MSATFVVDTSVAVPLVVADHEHHKLFSARVAGSEVGLAGHAAFETFSVLTRLPPPLRRDPSTVARLLRASFPTSVYLGARQTKSLLGRLERTSIAGGAVYDALVGAAAMESGRLLLSGDRRAVDVYRQLGVEFELLL